MEESVPPPVTHNASLCYWKVLLGKLTVDRERQKPTFISHFNLPLKSYIASGVINPYLINQDISRINHILQFDETVMIIVLYFFSLTKA